MTCLSSNYRRIFALIVLTILLVGFYAPIVRFEVSADGDWADPDCRYRMKLTFKNSASSENFADFPVLVMLNSSRIDYSKTNAADIRFYDGNTLLPKDTEVWNVSGNSYIWVKVPQIDNSDTDYIYAYYNASSSTNLDDTASVWSGYAMVQHLEETSGTLTDSTSNGNNGTTYGGVTQDYPGKMDGADSYDGSNDYSIFDNNTSLNFGINSFSLMFWFRSRAVTTQDILDAKGGTATDVFQGYKVVVSSVSTTGYSFALGNGTKNDRLDTGSHASYGTNVWTMLAVVVNRTGARMFAYLDGVGVSNTVITVTGNVYNAQNLTLGRQAGGTTRWFNGALDEIRVLSGAYSADWVKAHYLSTSDQYVMFGGEEDSHGSVPITLTVTNPQNVTYYQTTVALAGSTNLNANITYRLDTQANVSLANDTKTFSTSFTGLSYASHSVTVYVVETLNASNTDSATVYFTVAEAAWLSGWSYRRRLTVNGSLINEALTDFPVLVKLDSSFFDFNRAKDHGEDIRFAGLDGTSLLKYEVERWNKTAGKAEIWVRLPSVSSGSETVFYLYYGNLAASDAQDPANVWDSNYKMVQHLEEVSGMVTDSTVNDNDGTPYNGTTQGVSGKIDSAAYFDGVDDCIRVLHSDSLNFGTGPFTISVWINYPHNNVDADILRKGCTTNQPPSPANYKVELLSDRISANLYETGQTDSTVTTAGTYSDTGWHFVAFQREGQTIRLYVDGVLQASAGNAVHNLVNGANLSIGSKDTLDDDFINGTIDEVEISNTARSEAWLKASYNSMSDKLLTYGIEQSPHAPDKPFNPVPSHGSTGVSVPVTLSVNVTDSGNDTMDVYFYQSAVASPPPENFTVVVLPDTQIYSSSYPSVFDNQTLWIVDNAETAGIAFVAHEGDIVDDYSIQGQWDNANGSLSRLDGNVAWGVLPGNHDGISAGDTTTYNAYFGYDRFNGEAWYGGAYQDNNTNNFELFTGGNDDFLIFHFQDDPSDSVLAWANSTLGAYPNRRVIVVTHDYMGTGGTRSTIGDRMWQNFIVHHTDQVFLVLCGHATGEASRTDIVNGHSVYQLLANYQTRSNGGNGWLRTLNFRPAEDKIYVRTYSTYLNSYETDSDSEFTLDYDMTYSTGGAPELIGVATDVSNGGVASVVWSGLNGSTTYQWYAVAEDPLGASTQSDTWNFTTEGVCTLSVVPSVVEKNLSDVGTTFDVNVTVDYVQDLWGFDLNLTWDGSLLTLANTDFNTTLDNIWGTGNWYLVKNETGVGYYKLVAVSTLDSFNGTGTSSLATLTFRVEDPHSNFMEETAVHFETDKLSDSKWTPITHTSEDGVYRIMGEKPTLSVNPTGKTCRMYSETFTVQINVTNAANIEDFRFELHYNATLLDVVTVTWTAWGSGTMTIDDAIGNLTGYTSGSPINGDTTLITITFKVAYKHIWKDETTIPQWKNDLSGLVLIQWANLSYPSSPDLGYVRGGLNQISVGPDFVYTFSPIKGDVDNSGEVDLFDLRTVSFFYDQPNDTYNLTGESMIDIFDLVVIGSNYGYKYIP